MSNLPSIPPLADRSREELALWFGIHRRFVYCPQDFCEGLARGLRPADVLYHARAEPIGEKECRALREKLHACGVNVLLRTDPAYPERIARLADAPPLLFVRGEPDFAAPSVAVVGARAASVYGLRVARWVASQLAEAGVTVVSGLARGIDAEAHRAALKARGRSQAFLGCGIDRVYPAEHRRLARKLCERGAMLSEFPLGAPPRAPHFPLRNRLISGGVDAVVIVEARPRSGSLVTARHALEQGVDVWAVPGPITAPTSAGPLSLLRDGAAPLVEVVDLLAALGIENASAPSPAREERDPVLALLTQTPLDRDSLARALGRAPEEMASRLLELELEGRVREGRDGLLHVAR